jgi:plasmid maintenance system antidote protein VapI
MRTVMGTKLKTGRTEIERFESASLANRLLLQQERLILEVTELLSAALEESGLTKSGLAHRLGKTKGFVSQLFSGSRNLTLRTISDVADTLGVTISFQTKTARSRNRSAGRATSISTRRAAP